MIPVYPHSLRPEHIKSAMRNYGLGFVDLARMSGVSRDTIAKWTYGAPIRNTQKEKDLILVLNALEKGVKKGELVYLPKGIKTVA